MFKEGIGGAEMGEESFESVGMSGTGRGGGIIGATPAAVDSDEDASGVESIFLGVFSNSASVPSSVSSRQRTPRLVPFNGVLFFGVKDTLFFPTPTFRRFGEAFAGVELS